VSVIPAFRTLERRGGPIWWISFGSEFVVQQQHHDIVLHAPVPIVSRLTQRRGALTRMKFSPFTSYTQNPGSGHFERYRDFSTVIVLPTTICSTMLTMRANFGAVLLLVGIAIAQSPGAKRNGNSYDPYLTHQGER
jgi:hypothetical protein